MANESNRKTIIETIITALQDANVTDVADENYFRNPFRELDPDTELPGIKVGILRGASSRFGSGVDYDRNDELVIAYVAQGGDDLQEVLYHYGEKIEDFLIRAEASAELKEILDDLQCTGFDMALQNAEKATGALILRFALRYMTRHEPATTPLEGFEVQIKPADAPPADPPTFEESIDLPQP